MNAAITPNTKVQVVTPTGSGTESIFLLLAALLVAAIAAVIIMARSTHMQAAALQDYQLDLSTALTPAEQGIYTDLQAVFEELSWLYKADSTLTNPPTVTYWQEEGWPPFMNNPTANQRGNHQWQLLSSPNGAVAYQGMSADTELSGHVLWRVPAASKSASSATDFDLWVWKPQLANIPFVSVARLDADTLIAQGWKQVVAYEVPPQDNQNTRDFHDHAH